jgi:mannose-6-phosphate isomerase-like protein (cupin superfamily)
MRPRGDVGQLRLAEAWHARGRQGHAVHPNTASGLRPTGPPVNQVRRRLGRGSATSRDADPERHQVLSLRWWPVWLLVGLVAALGIVVGIDRAFFSGQGAVVVAAGAVRGAGNRRPLRGLRRARELGEAEAERAHDRAQRARPACVLGARPKGRRHVARRPARDAATGQSLAQGWQSSALRTNRDVLLLDQRGTGRSNPGAEELYLIVRGRVRVRLDQESVEAGAGTVVFVGEPSTVRSFTALEPDACVLAVGTNPGVEFVVSHFERELSPPPR